jgi:hypothetical protein
MGQMLASFVEQAGVQARLFFFCSTFVLSAHRIKDAPHSG